MSKALKKFVVGGGGRVTRVIMESALSLSLRDKDRVRDRESLKTGERWYDV